MIDAVVGLIGGEANTVAFAILAGVLGFIAKAGYDLWMERRKEKLDRINAQLRDLYGPLFSLVSASTITWEAFRAEYASGPEFRSESGIAPQTTEAAKVWRHWMTHVFMPLNSEMAELVVRHADLLEESQIPECLLLLCAHVHGYKGVIAAWAAHNYSEHMSLTRFPGDLDTYALTTYARLKSRQARLLGNSRGPSAAKRALNPTVLGVKALSRNSKRRARPAG
jgi:hypothetical protein